MSVPRRKTQCASFLARQVPMAKHLPVLQEREAPSPAPRPGPFDASRELPALQEAALDWDDLDCVLADLDDFAEILDLRGRNGREMESAPIDIVAARDALVSGELQGLQIRYAFADQVWVDTLLREDGGARLVRMIDSSAS